MPPTEKQLQKEWDETWGGIKRKVKRKVASHYGRQIGGAALAIFAAFALTRPKR